MELIRKNLILILVIAACVAAVVVYQNYFAGGPTSDTVISDVSTTGPDGGDFLQSLSGLKAVNLDGAVFNSPVFASLVDYGIDIPPEPVGRANPFAPLSNRTTQSGNAGVTSATVKPKP